jgi:predicted metalloendopeptidase
MSNEVSIATVFEQLGRLYVSRELTAAGRDAQADLAAQYKAAYEAAMTKLAKLTPTPAPDAPKPQE